VLSGFVPATAVETATSPAEWQPARAYWRPVVVNGKAFPVARSNYYSLLEFGNNWHAVRLRLIDGKWKPVGVHEGIDITAESGTPVLSMTDAHFSAVAPGIVPGARVRAGQMLGRVGNTGYGEDPGHRDEFPPHLHIGIEAGSDWVNPYPTLVSLYRAATARSGRDQAGLDALAARGDRERWIRRVERAFTSFEPG
jgi:murein DD-endopeptidase MepM/ murein hydrolase activator NlpD